MLGRFFSPSWVDDPDYFRFSIKQRDRNDELPHRRAKKHGSIVVRFGLRDELFTLAIHRG